MSVIGIDLGTTNSLVSVFRDGKCELIPNSFGDILTPSVVNIENNQVIVGKIAKERLITHSQNTVSAFKVFMGNHKTYYLDNKKYTPVDLSSMVIKQLVDDARKYLNEEIEEAIISVPAYFNDAKRLATKQAGELAGIKVERIINEPSAAALASRIDNTDFESLLIFDFGGGTLDVSIVDCFDDVVEIVAVSGDNHLGGEDFNHIIERYFIEQKHLEGLSVKNRAILLRNIEEMKKLLTDYDEVQKEIFIENQNIHLFLSRDILLKISEGLLFKMKNVVRHVLTDAKMNVTDIDRLIMVGGSSRLVVVQEYLEYLFHKKPEVSDQIDYLVGLGCGYVAGIKSRNSSIKDKILTDICSFSLGVGIHNPNGKQDILSIIIERNATLPCSHTELYTTIKDNQTKVNFEIYQGEDLIAQNNHFIGKMVIDVPPRKAGVEYIEVCFTYDINGILDVDMKSISTDENVHKIFTSQDCVLSKVELEKRMKELEKLKNNSDREQDLTYLFDKAYRIYQESTGTKRKNVESILRELEMVTKDGKYGQIERTKRSISQRLDHLDSESPFVFEEEDILN